MLTPRRSPRNLSLKSHHKKQSSSPKKKRTPRVIITQGSNLQSNNDKQRTPSTITTQRSRNNERSNTPSTLESQTTTTQNKDNSPSTIASDKTPTPRTIDKQQTPTASPQRNFTNMTWEDIDIDDKGVPIGCFNMKFQEIGAKQIRSMCTILQVRGIKDKKKDELIQRIIGIYHNHKGMETFEKRERTSNGGTTMSATRKAVQCSFRLLNLLFSEEFAERFASIGNVANRHQLDNGQGANEQGFWESVQEGFCETNEVYGTLRFQDDDVFPFDPEQINPSKIVAHNWKKLRQIWKGINSAYKIALAKYTQSGTHDNNFYSFCSGQTDVYYLSLWLKIKPNLTSTVVAELPEECAISSDQASSDYRDSVRGRQRKAKNSLSDVADAIKSFAGDTTRKEYNRKRMQQIDLQEKRKEKNEKRRAESHLEIQKNRKLARLTSLMDNIKSIHKDLRGGQLFSDEEEDLRKDLDELKFMKEELMKELRGM